MLLAEGMLFVELVKVMNDWLWHSDRIGNKPDLGLSCLGKFVVERAKRKMGSPGYDVRAIALCDSLLWMMIVAETTWSLAPSFIWTRGV
jgi:hypothetical protein